MSSKLIKRKCLYYILDIFVCFAVFKIFQENYTYAVDNLDSYHVFDSLDQANLICFWGVSLKLMKEKYFKIYFLHIWFYQENFINVYKGVIKVDKREYLDYMLSIFVCLCCFLFFPGKLPIYMRSKWIILGHITFLTPWIRPVWYVWRYLIKFTVVKEKYLDNILGTLIKIPSLAVYSEYQKSILQLYFLAFQYKWSILQSYSGKGV